MEGEGLGLRSGGVIETAKPPPGISRSGDEQSDAAARDMVMMRHAWLAAKEHNENVDGENDEGSSDQALADSVHVRREGEVKEDDGGAEDGDGEGVAESIEQAKSHAFAPVALNAGDIGDRGQMIVVESVAQAKEKTGDECKLKRGRHAGSKVRFRAAACKGVMDRDAC